MTNRAVLAVYRPLLEPLGLTHPQYLVMLALWDHAKSGSSADPMSVKDIAAALQLDPATLSPMLKRLETVGLLSRARCANDERSMEATLTDAGAALREDALAIPFDVVERLGVQLSELEQLRDGLNRVNAAALAAGVLSTNPDGN